MNVTQSASLNPSVLVPEVGPGSTPLDMLMHTVSAYEIGTTPDDRMAVMATGNVYEDESGQSITTGLTHGDLRTLAKDFSELRYLLLRGKEMHTEAMEKGWDESELHKHYSDEIAQLTERTEALVARLA